MKNRHSFQLRLITMVGLCICSVSQAEFTIIGPLDAPTGFTEISVSGTLYDVTFHAGTFDDVFGANPSLTFTTQQNATVAAAALGAALNNIDPIPPMVGPTAVHAP